MSVSCGKENSAGFVWLLSESGTVDYSAQDVQLGYKVVLDNGSSVSVTTDADWIKIGTPGESYVTLSVSRNDSRKESRTAEITVGYGDMAPLTYTLTQGYLRSAAGSESSAKSGNAVTIGLTHYSIPATMQVAMA